MTDHKAVGEDFLKAKSQEAGIVELEQGLLYQIEKSGDKTGELPKRNSTVLVNYVGKNIDGSIFDQGKSIELPLNMVIKGWTNALTQMRVGDKWTLYIHPTLAYGERGAPPVIQPNSTLIFDIELLDVL
tara:strand:+ start:52556 stop:52942 length:387 start_codon:yes stop_codon:yes gene_type:complete